MVHVCHLKTRNKARTTRLSTENFSHDDEVVLRCTREKLAKPEAVKLRTQANEDRKQRFKAQRNARAETEAAFAVVERRRSRGNVEAITRPSNANENASDPPGVNYSWKVPLLLFIGIARKEEGDSLRSSPAQGQRLDFCTKCKD